MLAQERGLRCVKGFKTAIFKVGYYFVARAYSSRILILHFLTLIGYIRNTCLYYLVYSFYPFVYRLFLTI